MREQKSLQIAQVNHSVLSTRLIDNGIGLSALKLGGFWDRAFSPVKNPNYLVVITDGKKVLTFTTGAAVGSTVLGGSI